MSILSFRIILIPHCSKLDVPLPQPVDESTGKAKWSKAKETLTIELSIIPLWKQ
jgi:hypothetical protein